MADLLANEKWRRVLDLAHAAADLPKGERLTYVESSCQDPEIIERVLDLAAEFDSLSDQPELDVGSQLGHFTITGRIGRGGMGQVFSAHDSELERTVALKVLTAETLAGPGSANKIVREARTASALNHPNIVTVYEVIRIGSTVAIIMEFVPGVPLRTLVGTDFLIDQFFYTARQIASALEAAHAAGIIHRDIKPENVILRPDRQVKVLDFGLAQQVTAGLATSHATSRLGLPAGTWSYMSPEQCKGESATGASDIFAFGSMLYELATGRHPFRVGESVFDTLQAIATREPISPLKWNPALPRAASDLILSMLKKDPAQRPSAASTALALAQLESVKADLPPRDLPSARRVAITILLLVLPAVCTAILYWQFFSKPQKPPRFTQVTTLVPENRASAAAISPDGKSSAYANTDGVFLRASQSGETSVLRCPDNFLVDQLAWFADQTKLLASGVSLTTSESSIWTLSTTGGPPRLVAKDALEGIPSFSGTQIAYTSRDRSALWVAGANGEEPRKVVSGPGDDTFVLLLWSPDSRQLGFQRRHYSGKQDIGFVMLDRYRLRSYETVDVATSKLVAKVPDMWIQSASMLPDGRILFLKMDSPGAHYSKQLWEVNTRPETGDFANAPRKVASPLNESNDHLTSVTSTADGKQVMVLRQKVENAVFVADFNAEPPSFVHPRRLTLDERLNFPHAWSRDSKAVLFESNRNGSWDVYSQQVGQRTPVTLAATPLRWEVMPQTTSDGRFVLYAAGRADGTEGPPYTLMRVPVEGGIAQTVPTDGPLEEFRCALSAGAGCVLRKSIARESFAYYELDPIKGIGRELARTAWLQPVVGDWDVSPDGKQIVIPNHDTRSAKIRTVRLDGRMPREHELNLPGLTDISGVTWAADGAGWFLNVDISAIRRMFYVYPDGRTHVLGNIHGWAVPSPDGRRVAFLDRIIVSNSWLIDRR